MADELYIVIISAGIGGVFTLIVTFLTNKARRFELEYAYKIKLEETYLSNAQKHLNDVYIPLYQALTSLKYDWLESRKLENIEELMVLRKKLVEKGLNVFLTPEIERNFDTLLDFISRSWNAEKVRYGLMYKDQVMGVESMTYKIVPEWINLNIVKFYRKIAIFWAFIKRITWIYTGLIDYEVRIILDSAPVGSDEFEEQFLDYLTHLEKRIKCIALGTI